MEKQMIYNTILNQRAALYEIHKQSQVARIDIEVLMFSVKKMFFNSYDLQTFYPHTNVQMINRSLKKMSLLGYLTIYRRGYKRRPTLYVLSKAGKEIIEDYCDSIASRD